MTGREQRRTIVLHDRRDHAQRPPGRADRRVGAPAEVRGRPRCVTACWSLVTPGKIVPGATVGRSAAMTAHATTGWCSPAGCAVLPHYGGWTPYVCSTVQLMTIC